MGIRVSVEPSSMSSDLWWVYVGFDILVMFLVQYGSVRTSRDPWVRLVVILARWELSRDLLVLVLMFFLEWELADTLWSSCSYCVPRMGEPRPFGSGDNPGVIFLMLLLLFCYCCCVVCFVLDCVVCFGRLGDNPGVIYDF